MSPAPEPPAAGAPDQGEGELVRSVRERAGRRAFWLAHGERPLARNLAMIGALGWLVVTPTLAGLFAGRWLDQRLGSHIFWTGGLLTAGMALGCVLAWRRIQQIQKEDD